VRENGRWFVASIPDDILDTMDKKDFKFDHSEDDVPF